MTMTITHKYSHFFNDCVGFILVEPVTCVKCLALYLASLSRSSNLVFPTEYEPTIATTSIFTYIPLCLACVSAQPWDEYCFQPIRGSHGRLSIFRRAICGECYNSSRETRKEGFGIDWNLMYFGVREPIDLTKCSQKIAGVPSVSSINNMKPQAYLKRSRVDIPLASSWFSHFYSRSQYEGICAIGVGKSLVLT